LITGSLTPTVTSNYTSCAGGSITINYSGSDACGNLLSAQHIIAVTPPTTPIIAIPTGLPNTLSYNNALSYNTAPNATYTNNEPTNCLIDGTIPASITSNFDICNGGTITIDYNGQDLCGNTLTAQHIINVTPEVPFVSINSTLSVIDINQPTQLTAFGTPVGGTYTWSPSGTLDTSTGDVVNATPTTTTTYTVSYTIGNNCSATASTTITVNALTLSINSTTICSGSSTTLTATPSVSGGSYLWSPGGQNTQSITVSPNSNAIYTCVYTLNGVASSPTIGTVTVNPTPSVTVNNPTICDGTSAVITAVGNPGGGSYSWSTGQSTASISVSPTTTTSYIVTYTLNGCTGTATSTVNVNPQPTVTVNSPTICAGQNATLTASVSPSGGNLLWNNSQSTGSISVSPTVTTTYSVMYTLNGCVATGTGAVTVNTIPSVSVSSVTICNGESATINAAPSAAGGSYSWSPGGATTQSITVNPSITTSYSVTYTLNGCSSQGASGSVTVNPVAAISVNNTSICAGENATLTATPSQPGGTFLWSPNGETTSSISASPNATTSYSVVYTLNGCESLPASGLVTVNPIPTVSFVGDQLTGCAPLTVNFTNTSGNPSNCTWNLGNGQSITGCTSTYTFTQGGCYNITLTSIENGCSNSLTLTDYICVEGQPVASFTTNPTEFSQPSETVSFYNSSVGATSYSWDFGDSQNSTDENPVHNYSSTNNGYTITLTASSSLGCTDTYQVTIEYLEGEIFYIPNSFTPDGDNFNQTFKPVFTSGFDPYNFEMLIYNRWGNLIFETHDVNVGWDGSYGTEGRDVQQGIYTYKITYKNPRIDERKTVVGHVTIVR
jgi:gliding motility-associated-like protein